MLCGIVSFKEPYKCNMTNILERTNNYSPQNIFYFKNEIEFSLNLFFHRNYIVFWKSTECLIYHFDIFKKNSPGSKYCTKYNLVHKLSCLSKQSDFESHDMPLGPAPLTGCSTLKPQMLWDWNLDQLVLGYYWLTFLHQVNVEIYSHWNYTR